MARRPKGEQGFDSRISVECYGADVARWDAAAESAGQSRAEWIRRALDAACKPAGLRALWSVARADGKR